MQFFHHRLRSTTLTERERALVMHVLQGAGNKEIARTLGLSPNTVKTHIANLFAKLEVGRRTQAISKARETKPEVYVRVIAGLLPSEANVNINRSDGLSDDELRERIAGLAARLAPFLGSGDGGDAPGLVDARGEGKPARVH